jgi:lysophospholipase L1-like esterase
MKYKNVYMNRILLLIFFSLSIVNFCTAQIIKEYTTWNPAKDSLQVLEGQAWPNDVKNFYDRLPAKAEAIVRKPVWDLSRNAAGLQLRFQTNADEIIVKYMVSSQHQMPHMPATGASGIDLYAKTIDGKWSWAAGKYAFGDTIVYRFSNLSTNDQHVKDHEYNLYLPLYNTVKWMEISYPKQSSFKPIKVSTQKPIVVYGTSIAQGGCASRPGLAWTNILQRKLDRPIINLAFSGNGRLENEILDMITGIDAKLFVLDCLPNLTGVYVSNGELHKRLVNAVVMLQAKKPGIPILLTEHDGFTDEGMNPQRKKDYQEPIKVMTEVFDSLLQAGVKNIYRLTKEAINQDIESTVDGTHPNDIGMMHYADAYEKKIKSIFLENEGKSSTTIPVTQRRDAATYDWETRHNQIIQYTKENQPHIAFIGNSITHFWGGNPSSKRINGKQTWEKYFGSKQVVNMGFGWDRIENVLWRVYHGELDNFSPEQIVLMIGTNNLQFNTNEEIIEGLQLLISAIKLKQPKAKLIMMGILPRRGMEERVVQVNKLINKLSSKEKITYANAGKLFVQGADKKIDESLFSDGLHPNEKGYDLLGAFIEVKLKK